MKLIVCIGLLIALCSCVAAPVEDFVMDSSVVDSYDGEKLDLLNASIDELYANFGPPFSGMEHIQGMPQIPSYPEEFGGYTTYQGSCLILLLTELTPETVARYQSYVTHPEILRFMRSEYSLNDLIGVSSNIQWRASTIERDLSIEILQVYPQSAGYTGTEIGRVRVDVIMEPEQDADLVTAYFHENYGDRVVVAFHQRECESPVR